MKVKVNGILNNDFEEVTEATPWSEVTLVYAARGNMSEGEVISYSVKAL